MSARRTAPDGVGAAGIDLAVEGMTCASCVARVEKRLNRVPGATATVNLALETAHVEITPTDDAPAPTVADLVAAVRELNTALGIPAQVRQLKVDAVQYRAHLPSMAANALEDICTQSNPRMPSLDDLAELLLRAW